MNHDIPSKLYTVNQRVLLLVVIAEITVIHTNHSQENTPSTLSAFHSYGSSFIEVKPNWLPHVRALIKNSRTPGTFGKERELIVLQKHIPPHIREPTV